MWFESIQKCIEIAHVHLKSSILESNTTITDLFCSFCLCNDSYIFPDMLSVLSLFIWSSHLDFLTYHIDRGLLSQAWFLYSCFLIMFCHCIHSFEEVLFQISFYIIPTIKWISVKCISNLVVSHVLLDLSFISNAL